VTVLVPAGDMETGQGGQGNKQSSSRASPGVGGKAVSSATITPTAATGIGGNKNNEIGVEMTGDSRARGSSGRSRVTDPELAVGESDAEVDEHSGAINVRRAH